MWTPEVDARGSRAGRGFRVRPGAERRPVPAARAADPARQARWSAAHGGPAAPAGRAVLPGSHRLPVASPAAAAPVPALAHGVRLLPRLPGRGRVGGHPSPPRGHAARGRGPGPGRQPRRGHHRCPERRDDGKGGPRGWDAAKRLKGRKRHVAVDTQGPLLGVAAHAADIRDADGPPDLLRRVKPLYPWLRAVFADGTYDRLAALLACFLFGPALLVVRRAAGSVGFVVQPRRWGVERTLRWLGRWRRLSKVTMRSRQRPLRRAAPAARGPRYPASAKMARTKGNSARVRRSSTSAAPSRSCTPAACTTTFSSSPSVPTRTWYSTPLVLLPASKPAGSIDGPPSPPPWPTCCRGWPPWGVRGSAPDPCRPARGGRHRVGGARPPACHPAPSAAGSRAPCCAAAGPWVDVATGSPSPARGAGRSSPRAPPPSGAARRAWRAGSAARSAPARRP